MEADRARSSTTGKVLWERVAHEGIPKTKRHPKSSQASPTPVTDGTHVIVSFGSEGLYAYDIDGKLLWKQDLGVLNAGWFYDPDYEWGVGSSPIIWKNLVIVQCDIQKNSFVAAFDVTTGKPVWRTAREEIPSWSTPTIFETTATPSWSRRPRRSSAATTRRPAKSCGGCPAIPRSPIPTPIAGPGTVIVTNGYRGVQPIFAIKPGARATSRSRATRPPTSSSRGARIAAGPYIPTPVIYGDLLYVLAINGVLAAYDVEDRRAASIRNGSPAGGSFSASPVAADGKLYLTSEDGDVFVVKAGRTTSCSRPTLWAR